MFSPDEHLRFELGALTDEMMDLKAEVWAGLRKLREILKGEDAAKFRAEALAEVTRLQDLVVRDRRGTDVPPIEGDPEE